MILTVIKEQSPILPCVYSINTRFRTSAILLPRLRIDSCIIELTRNCSATGIQMRGVRDVTRSRDQNAPMECEGGNNQLLPSVNEMCHYEASHESELCADIPGSRLGLCRRYNLTVLAFRAVGKYLPASSIDSILAFSFQFTLFKFNDTEGNVFFIIVIVCIY